MKFPSLERPNNSGIDLVVQHTGYNIHATAGTRTQATAVPAAGQLVQVDVNGQDGIIDRVAVALPTAISGSVGLGGSALLVVVGKPIDSRIGLDASGKVISGSLHVSSSPFCMARVRAVDADIAIGTELVWNSAQVSELRDAAAKRTDTLAHYAADNDARMSTGLGTTGMGKTYARALATATVAETTTAGTYKLIPIEIVDREALGFMVG